MTAPVVSLGVPEYGRRIAVAAPPLTEEQVRRLKAIVNAAKAKRPASDRALQEVADAAGNLSS